MKTTIPFFALLALGLPAFAQAPAHEHSPQDRAIQDRAKQERVQIRQQIENLGSPDFEIRKRAAKKLEAYGKKARELLKETVRESDDAEQVWQARRLLRRMDEGRPSLKAQPRTRAQNWPQGRPQNRPGARGQGTRGQRHFQIDMNGFPGFLQGDRPEEFAQRMREFLEQMQTQGFPSGMQGNVHSEGTSVRMGPDGVEVDIQVVEDGKKKRKNYKAKTMEELLQKYPELKGKVHGFTESLRIPSFGGSQIDDLEREIQDMERRLQRFLHDDWVDPFPKTGLPGGGSAPRKLTPHKLRPQKLRPQKLPSRKSTPHKLRSVDGPKLGVYVGTADTRPVARFLGLPEGVGLWVEDRSDGSLAERLGLTKGDFLVKLGDRWIRGPQDVAKALSGKKKGQQLQARWYRKGRKMQKAAKL